MHCLGGTIAPSNPLAAEENIVLQHVPRQIGLGLRFGGCTSPVESAGSAAGGTSRGHGSRRTLLNPHAIAVVDVSGRRGVQTAGPDQPVLAVINVVYGAVAGHVSSRIIAKTRKLIVRKRSRRAQIFMVRLPRYRGL